MFWIFSGIIAVFFTVFLFYRIAKNTSVKYAAVIIFIVPFFTLGGLFLAKPSAEPGEKVFNIKARQFAYEPSVIRVNKGDRVVLRLTSKDVTHGFYLDGYGIDAEIKPHGHGGGKPDDGGTEPQRKGEEKAGENNNNKGEVPKANGHEKESVEGRDDKKDPTLHGQGEEESGHSDTEEIVTEVKFLANSAGRFGFRCSRPCGSLHPFMVGKLIVEPNYLYTGSLGLTVGLLISTLTYLLARREKSHATKN